MYLWVFKREEKFGLRFLRQNSKKKGMTHTVSSYKLTSKPYLMYLKIKLQQDTCGWCNYKLKCHKTAEITYLEANKQQRRYRLTYLEVSKLEQRYGWCFLRLKCNNPSAHDVFRDRNSRMKVRLTYLQVWKLGKSYGWCFWRPKM